MLIRQPALSSGAQLQNQETQARRRRQHRTQYRYNVEYKLAVGQSGGWCAQDRYRNKGVGNDTLNTNALKLDVTNCCSGAAPVIGEGHNFRIRASYVWRNSADTNWRNGSWVYSGHVEYNPTVYNQN